MNCEWCQSEMSDSQRIYSIPLDERGETWSGAYCSPNCALTDNERVNRNMRMVDGCDQRREWFYQLVTMKNQPRDKCIN